MLPFVVVLLLVAAGGLNAASVPAGVAVLQKRCAGCHAGEGRKSGLDVTSRKALLRGGDRGPAVTPGSAQESLLYRVSARTAEPHMPMGGGALPPAELETLRAWIDEGAEFETKAAAAPVTSDHWAFQPVRRAAAGRSIDDFLDAARQAKGIKAAAPEADAATLARRVYLDLAGVPPTPDEVREFRYEDTVDKLLADPRYGERWGRHWMDVWRYSDWYGYRRANEVRNSMKFIWRWRDWIVESLNADKGYDRMVTEMLAGDEIAPGDPQVLRATGYLARNYTRYDRQGWMQNVVDHSAMAFLGLTLKCARCHDHKYDPLKQTEYYQFRAFFEPYDVRTDRVPGETDTDKDGLPRVYDKDLEAATPFFVRGDVQHPDPETKIEPAVPGVLNAVGLAKAQPVALNVEQYYPDVRGFVHRDLLAKARADLAAAEAAVPKAKEGAEKEIAEKAWAAAKAYLPALEARIAADKAAYSRPPAPEAEELATVARKAERDYGVLRAAENLLRAQVEMNAALAAAPVSEKRVNAAQAKLQAAIDALKQAPEGQYTRVGEVYPEKSSGRRLALARWITDAKNPLTARVAVNHIWMRHFGEGLVSTPSDFGKSGRAPSHPELLDFLASELMANQWSMKHVHRLILNSRAYRMRSNWTNEANAKADPENRLLWRMNTRRMEAEIVRDSVLAVAGSLDRAMGGPDIDGTKALESRRRTIYLQQSPDVPIPFLKVFDAPSPLECYRRDETVAPHQALALVNSGFSREQARALAEQLHGAGQYGNQFAAAAFETVLGRAATPAELAKAAPFAERAEDRQDLVHVLFNHNDFVTIH
ncbi:MAG: DUF1553 domain-containing protein [Bryobacterales bacterium]|nr:DUF1553 domain-containing protein [Bryobacterales bacterium]